MTTTYKIIRYRKDSTNRVIKRGLSKTEAQEHCQREDTHGKNWFDGYTSENN